MALSAQQLKVGDTHSEQVVDNLTRTQIVQYAGASGDYNPIHTDEVYTPRSPAILGVAHGMLTMGMTGKMLTNYVGDDALLNSGCVSPNRYGQGCAHGQSHGGSDSRGRRPTVCRPATFHRNQHGEEVLSGYASARLDP